MMAREFLHWQRKSSAADRAEAIAALARDFLYADWSAPERAAAEGALILALDDGSPLVRAALAQALAFSESAPPPVILALAADQPEVASWVLEYSPLLLDADLVDAVATGGPTAQMAIANRAPLPCAVAAALAEVASAESCLILIENDQAEIAPSSLHRIVERYGHLAAIREALLQRDDLPASTRCALVAKLSETLVGFVASRDWLDAGRAQRVMREACEKAAISVAAVSPEDEIPPLVRHLRESGQLTAGLILRALLSGNVELFEQALADLSGLPIARVSALVHDRRGNGLRALYDRAGLPASTFAAFNEALVAMREGGFVGDDAGAARLKRRMVERVLTRCADAAIGDIEPLLTLLRRFAAEAARDEARLACDLVADEEHEPQRAAA